MISTFFPGKANKLENIAGNEDSLSPIHQETLVLNVDNSDTWYWDNLFTEIPFVSEQIFNSANHNGDNLLLTPPALTCPPNVIKNTITTACFASHTWSTPMADAGNHLELFFDGVSQEHPIAATNFGIFSKGITTVSIEEHDGSEVLVSSCSFTIEVRDNVTPTITGCPADIVVNDVDDGCNEQVFWTAPTPNDNCMSTLSSTFVPGNFFNVGTTLVTYTNTDGSIYSSDAICTFNVTVHDVTAPVISCPGNAAKNNTPGFCYYTVSGTEFDATATDNCGMLVYTYILSGATTGSNVGSLNGVNFNVGTTTVSWSVDDGENIDVCSFDVEVTDNEDPVAVCPTAPTVYLDGSGNGTLPADALAGGLSTDNCMVSGESSPATPFGCGDIGVQMVQLTAADNAAAVNTGTEMCSVNVVGPVRNASIPASYCSIQAAINAASPGHTIQLFDNITEGQVTINKDITLDGGGFTLTSTSVSYGISIQSPGVTIQNITVEGAGTFGIHQSPGSDNLTISNTTTNMNSGTGIALNCSTTIGLTDITSTNNGGNGISITDCHDVTITNITTSGNTFGTFGAGVGIFTSTYCTPGSSNIVIGGTISIAEVPAVYEEIGPGGGTITGVTLPASYTHFVGIGATKFYYTSLGGALDAADAVLAGAPAYQPFTYVEEIASGDHWVAPKNTATVDMSIQAAIDFAAPGITVNVYAGTYDESITINKALTLNGPNVGLACGGRVAEAILAPAAGTPVTIAADGVTLNGFEITAPHAYYAVNLGSTSNTAVLFNNIHDIGTTPTGGGNVHAIVYSVGSSSSTTVAITDNCLNNISSSALSGFSASAIGILQSTSTGVLDGINIMRNVISNVNVNTGTWPTGKIAYGIQINVAGGSGFASSTGNAKNAVVSFNTITGVEGFIATGIALEGNTEDAIITRNEVTNLTAYKLANRSGGGFDLNGLKFENNRFVSTVTVENNSFDASTFTHNGTLGLGYAVANYVPEADGGVASLSCNWFGSAIYGDLVVDYNAAPAPTGKIFNKDGAGTSFITYLTNSTIDSGAGGYSCSGAHATSTSLNVAYTAASENIVVTFNVANNSVAEYPIPGLNPTVPADQIVIANKYVALQTALLTGTPAQVVAAALDLGDDIITEYFYMDGVNEVYLQTAGASDLVKNKYWDQYLNNSTTSTAYPNFGTNLFVVPTGPYSTSTNPLTGTVASDWLSPVYGKDLHVRVTVIHNGNVDIKTETVAIGLGPVRVYSDLAETNLVSSHISIQAAINAATTMDGYVVRVEPGTYAEDIIVDKELIIRGSNANNCANGARVTETIIHPATTSPFGEIIKVQASNVTIEGFLIDGDNPALTSGILGTNGADLDAAEAVTVYVDNVHNLTVQNNIIQNLTYFGVTIFGASYSAPVTSGHLVECNKFQDLGTYLDPEPVAANNINFWGGGVLIYNDQYTRIANNTMTNVRLGVQTGNFHRQNPGAATYQVIDGNTIQARKRGIFYNLHTGNPSALTLSNNTITALADVNEVTNWDGILLSSLSDAVGVVSGNVINGLGVTIPSEGIEVWNVKDNAPVSISGGTISNVDIGLFLDNYEGYNSDAGNGAHAVVSGLSINPNSTGTGIRLLDSPSSTTHADVRLEMGTGVTVTGGTDGLVIENANAALVDVPTADGYTDANDLALDGQTSDYIKLINNAFDVDGTALTFDGNLINATTRLAIEAKVLHKADDPALGLVIPLIPCNTAEQVTNSATGVSYCTIQEAIDAATGGIGEILSVTAGNYPENVVVNKALTISGANAGIACGSRVAESVIAPSSGVPFTVTADGVTINGFEITAPGATNAVVCGNTSDLNIIFNNIHHIGNTLTGGNVHAIHYNVANGGATSNVTVSDNCFEVISSSLLTGFSTSAIGFLQSSSTGVLTGLNIERNTINSVNVNSGNWPTGKIAYGIQINVGSANYLTTTGKVVNAVISNNEITNLGGFISTGIALEGNTEDAMVENNIVVGLSGRKLDVRSGGGYDLQGLKFETNRYVSTVTVKNNSFQTDTYVHDGTLGLGYAIANYVPTGNSYSGGTTAAAATSCNWHGTALYSEIVDNATLTGKIFNKDGCETTFQPYLLVATEEAGGDIGFQPSLPNACAELPVNITSATPADQLCGILGTIEVAWSDGTGPFDVSWAGPESGSATNVTSPFTIPDLDAGTYEVTVEAAGSQSTASVSISYLPVKNTTGPTYYATIGAAIAAANDNDVIEVCEGTYDEDLVINKPLTLNGPNVGIDPNVGPRVGEAILLNSTIGVTAPATGTVSLDGFTIMRDDALAGDVVLLGGGSEVTVANNIIQRNGSAPGTNIRAIVTSSGSGVKNITNNLFTGDISNGVFGGHTTWNNAIYINGGGSTVNITDNKISNSRTALNLDDYQSNIVVSGNSFETNGTHISFGGTAPTNGSFVFGSNDFNSLVDAFINLSNVDPAFRLDITSSSYNGAPLISVSDAVLFEVETHMYHKENFSGKKGKVIYRAGNQYVNNIPGKIDVIQNSVLYADANDIINLQDGTYNQSVVVAVPNITLQGVTTDKTQYIIDGTGLPSVGTGAGSRSGIKINNDITEINIKNLTVQNFNGASGNLDAGIYGIGGNNTLLVDNVALLNNVNGSGFYANGPVNGVTVTNSMVSGHTVGARGIVIWNGFKENITITDNMVTNNNCCGIELQDGTASAVNISNNTIDIGSGDNAIAALGLNDDTGGNMINSNIITGGGRFGIEIKNPNGGVTVDGNNIELTTANSDLRDRAGIAIMRRDFTLGNPAGYPDIPNGVMVTNNTVEGYQQSAADEGFGIVIEGTGHVVSGNTLIGNDIGIQLQGGGHANANYVANDVGSGSQNAGDSPNYFGRGNSPEICETTLGINNYSGNGADVRLVTDTEFSDDIAYITTKVSGAIYNQTQDTYHCTIQDAIDNSNGSPGFRDIIIVPDGIYKEELVISKDHFELRGNNYGIDPCSGVRSDESVLMAPRSNPDPTSATGVYLMYFDGHRSDVVIEGFTFEGDNPDFTSGVVFGGADVDAVEAMSAYDGISDVQVKNNIFQNLNYAAIDFYNYTNGGAATKGNLISYNKFENILPSLYGIGVLIYNNAYTDITNNCMQDVRIGIQTGNFYQAHPDNLQPNISNNTIVSQRLGIFHNLAYSGAATFNITNNTISSTIGATNNDGILVSSIGGAVDVNIIDNIISNTNAGIEFWNCTSTAVVTANGGTITNAQYGVFANNFEGYNSNANSGAVGIDGINIDGAAIAGVYVLDSPDNTNNATIDLTVNHCTINNSVVGVLIEGSDATATINYNDITSNATFGVNNLSGNQIDATSNWWGDASGPQHPATNPGGAGDEVSDNVAYCPWLDAVFTTGQEVGPVHNVDTDEYFCSIQDAVDDIDTDAGDVITVSSGTYTEVLVVNKGVTIQGPNVGVAPNCTGNRANEEAVIATADGSTPVTVAANGVTLDGFTITNPEGNNAIYSSGFGGLTVKNNIITSVGNNALTGNTHAIAVSSNTAAITGVIIEDNRITDIHGGENPALTGAAAKANNKSGSAIGIGWSDSNNDIAGVVIQRNCIDNVSASDADWLEGGKGAYGIILNVGYTGSGQVLSPQILENKIDQLAGLWSHGIGLEGDTPDANVQNNAISNLTDNKVELDAAAIMVEGNASAASVMINNNSFVGVEAGVRNVTGITVDATCNWWESTDLPTITGKYVGLVTASPFLTSGTDDSGAIGFQPEALACGGEFPIHNVTRDIYFATIQDAIDDANTMALDVIRVLPADFTEPGQIHVTKSLTIEGLGKANTTVRSNYNTASSGHGNDLSAWILTDPGTNVIIREMTLDATGKDTYTGVRFRDGGAVTNVAFNEIKHSASPYLGIAVQVQDGNVDVTGCMFTEIGRIGVHYRRGVITGATISGLYDNNMYTGKGDGNWLDYALDISGGTTVTVSNSEILNNTGVASDGSTSAGILVTSYFPTTPEGPLANNVTITNNNLHGNTTGVAVGFDEFDLSVVVIHNNDIYDNDYGVTSTGPQVNASLNWWGDATGPQHPTANPDGTGNPVSDKVEICQWLGASFTVPGLPVDVVPLAVCGSDFSVVLDANGMASISVSDVDNGSYDPCETPTLSLDVSSFDCDDLGPNTVTLTAEDAAMQSTTCSVIVTVVDNPPVIVDCPANIVQGSDAGLCSAVVTWTPPTASRVGYEQDFEDAGFMSGDSYGDWQPYGGDVVRVASGTNGITSATGSAHGLATGGVIDPDPEFIGPYTRLGGYSSDFGTGYVVSVDVYMDLTDPAVTSAPADTYGWDLSVASSNQSGNHLQDFIFHTASNDAGHILVGGSNNTNFTRRNDLASLNHFEITSSAWYTFQWVFRDDGAGVLAVDLNLVDDGGTILWTETRSTPTNLISTVVGGNRYMWFTFIEAENLPIDNVILENNAVIVCDHEPGDVFPVGTTTVTYTATSACGTEVTCTFDVTVNDTEKPEFVDCPAPIVSCADASTLSWSHVELTDNCSLTGGTLSYTLSGATTKPATTVAEFDGSTMGTETFNEGITTVTYTASDAAGNLVNGTCSFTVTIHPLPDFDITADYATWDNTSGNSASVPDAGVGATYSWSITNGVIDSGDGTSSISFTSGNAGTVELSVTVTDGNTCSSSATATVIVLDPCSSPDFSNPIALAPNGSEGVGLWSVDRYEPEIFESPATAPDGTMNTLHHGIDAADGQASGFYNTQGRRYALHPSSIETEIELYVPADWGTTGRRMAGLWGEAFDATNTLSGYPIIEFTSDGGTPRFRGYEGDGSWHDMGLLPGFAYDQWVTMRLQVLASGEFRYTVETAQGNLIYNTTLHGVNGSTHFKNIILQGHNTTAGVTYDIYWNNQGASPVDFNFLANGGEAQHFDTLIYCYGTPVDFEITGPNSADTYTLTFNGNPVSSGNVNDPEYSFTATLSGTYELTVMNGDGCSLTEVYYVEVQPAPTITCTSNQTRDTDPATCTYTVVGTEFDPVITGSCTPLVVTYELTGATATGVTTANSLAGLIFYQGTTHVTWTVTDAANNTATCTFDVEVEDNEIPGLSCPANIVSNSNPSICGNTEFWINPTATDNCTATPTLAWDIFDKNNTLVSHQTGLMAGNGVNYTFGVGENTVTYTATDASGNPATCSFTVTVNDVTDPTISGCPAAITVDNQAGQCGANVSWVAPIASDNCSGVTLNGTHVPGSFFGAGTTTVTYTATDVSLNTATCTFDITVTDTENPAITCPAAITTVADPGVCEATVTFVAPVGTDNCSGATTIQTDATGLSSGSVFPAGTTTLEFTVTDGATNSFSCTMTVTVTSAPVAINDVSPPSLPGVVMIDLLANDTDCDTNIDVSSVDIGPAVMGQQTTMMVLGEGEWSVNASGVITFTPEVGFTIDPTPITYTVGDGSSQTSNIATITVDYVPVAVDDLSDNNNAGPVEVDVLSNDTQGDLVDPTTVQIVGSGGIGLSLVIAGEGTWSVNGTTGAITFDPEIGFTGNPTPIFYTVLDDELNESNQAMVTVEYTLCVEIEAWVYLEGATIVPNGSQTYSLPMRTTLNDLRLLPGQLYTGFGTFYSPVGQPYVGAPWMYNGTEGLGYDSEEIPAMADAGYPATVVDWVLVSLREVVVDPVDGDGDYPDETPICTAAALLHSDGSIEFIDDFTCCDLDNSSTYYLVIEHRNHLMVASHEPLPIVNGKISYDFRDQNSFIQDFFGSPNGVGQKEVLSGVFVMYAGNGDQVSDGSADTDLNVGDEAYWKTQNGESARYRNGDYNMNGDPNGIDRILWGFNNGNSTSVPRN